MSVIALACLYPDFPHSDEVDDLLQSEFITRPELPSHTPLPAQSLVFTYAIPGSGESVEVDYSTTLLKDNFFSENLAFKGDGHIISVFLMRDVIIQSTKIIRSGDFSLVEEFSHVDDFFKEFGAIHHGITPPSFN